MSAVGQREILTQRRVIAFFRDALGYAYLGDWQDRPDNRNIEPALLTDWLKRQGHNDGIITKVLRELEQGRLHSAAARHSTTPTVRSTTCSATGSRSGRILASSTLPSG